MAKWVVEHIGRSTIQKEVDDIKRCKCDGLADWYHGNDGGFIVMCGDCLLDTPAFSTLEEAIAAWNLRA